MKFANFCDRPSLAQASSSDAGHSVKSTVSMRELDKTYLRVQIGHGASGIGHSGSKSLAGLGGRARGHRPYKTMIYLRMKQPCPSPPIEGGDKSLFKVPLLKGDLGGSGLGYKRDFSRLSGLS